MESNSLPLGFGMALVQNEEAMRIFESMSEAQKLAVIQQTHRVRSKREMQQLVSDLVRTNTASS